MKSPSFLSADRENQLRMKQNIRCELEAFASERSRGRGGRLRFIHLHYDPVSWTQIIISVLTRKDIDTPPSTYTHSLLCIQTSHVHIRGCHGSKKALPPFFKDQKLQHSEQNDCHSINSRASYLHKCCRSYCDQLFPTKVRKKVLIFLWSFENKSYKMYHKHMKA